MQPNKHKTSKCHNYNVIKQFISSQQTHNQLMSQSQCYQTIYMQPNKYTTSKCQNHNVIKQFIRSQTNTQPVNVTIIMLSNGLYAAKHTPIQQISQSQRYKTIYMQPNKYTSSKCHNHDVIKQFISSQTSTRPVTVTITMLSNSLYAAK